MEDCAAVVDDTLVRRQEEFTFRDELLLYPRTQWERKFLNLAVSMFQRLIHFPHQREELNVHFRITLKFLAHILEGLLMQPCQQILGALHQVVVDELLGEIGEHLGLEIGEEVAVLWDRGEEVDDAVLGGVSWKQGVG